MKTKALCLAALSAVAGHAQTYTDAAAFAANTLPCWTNDFGDCDYFGFTPDPTTYAAQHLTIAALSYPMAYSNYKCLTTPDGSAGLQLQFAPPVTAAGLDVWLEDPLCVPTPGVFAVSVNGGPPLEFRQAQFFGCCAQGGITNLTIWRTNDWSQPETALYVVIDNVRVTDVRRPELTLRQGVLRWPLWASAYTVQGSADLSRWTALPITNGGSVLPNYPFYRLTTHESQ